jgi:AAA+ ATPase superfamily predicted ATPase
MKHRTSLKQPPLIVIVGPTAVGKTRLSLRLVQEFGGEIISADSRQVYRGMDIGTAKPTLEERHRVPHHLIDVVAPDEAFTLAQYQELAYDAIGDVLARGKVPFLVRAKVLSKGVITRFGLPECGEFQQHGRGFAVIAGKVSRDGMSFVSVSILQSTTNEQL